MDNLERFLASRWSLEMVQVFLDSTPSPTPPPQTRLQGAAGCLFTNELLHHRLLLLCPLLHSFSACCGGRQQCCKTNPHGIGQNVDEKCSLGKKTQGGVFRPYGLISSIMVCWHNQGLNTGRPARCVYVNTGGGRRSCPGPDRVGVLATGSHEVAASIWNQVMERHLELNTHRLQAALGKKWAPECRVGGSNCAADSFCATMKPRLTLSAAGCTSRHDTTLGKRTHGMTTP